ncbi:hypothetical protein HDU76_010601 [Blyttiomyces sp. JEL0837]|nr:hypothetical protein HDU76_010601 [Blyttiomyces sp. JEL0837]
MSPTSTTTAAESTSTSTSTSTAYSSSLTNDHAVTSSSSSAPANNGQISRKKKDKVTETIDPLDVFEAALSVVFEEPVFAMGNSGESYTYSFTTSNESHFNIPTTSIQSTQSPSPQPSTKEPQTKTHTLTMHLANFTEAKSVQLMAHFIWQAAFTLSKRITTNEIDVRGARVIELGAGAGLVGIVAGLCGATEVIGSDYPDPGILEALKRNFVEGLGGMNERRVGWENCGDVYWDVVGHQWGDEETIKKLMPVRTTPKPLHIILADVLWMPSQHAALLHDLEKLLPPPSQLPETQPQPSAIGHIAAGLHTGRPAIESFIRQARERGFTVRKLGEMRVGPRGIEELEHFDENVSEERRIKEEGDPTEKKRWVLLYDLWRL